MQKRVFLSSILSVMVLVTSSCSSTHSAVSDTHDQADTFETYNRAMFKFNYQVDKYVLKPLAEGYRAALNAMAERMDLKNDVSVGMLSRFPDVLTQTAAPTNEDELWEDVRAVAEQAVDAFIAMRAVEGEKMKADVSGRLTTIEALVGQIEENSAGRVQAYSDKLYARLQELLGDRSIDEGRLVTEAAIFADKTAIDEETVRLHSHVAQYREILALDEPIGRKLDFLTQELNRESNTIGSKCQDVAITRLVVELKSEIEKIREQIQNIE